MIFEQNKSDFSAFRTEFDDFSSKISKIIAFYIFVPNTMRHQPGISIVKSFIVQSISQNNGQKLLIKFSFDITIDPTLRTSIYTCTECIRKHNIHTVQTQLWSIVEKEQVFEESIEQQTSTTQVTFLENYYDTKIVNSTVTISLRLATDLCINNHNL